MTTQDKQNTDLLPQFTYEVVKHIDKWIRRGEIICKDYRLVVNDGQGSHKYMIDGSKGEEEVMRMVCATLEGHFNEWNTRNTASMGDASTRKDEVSSKDALLTSPTSTDEMREEFEQWWVKHVENYDKVPNAKQDAWTIWCASQEAAYNIIPSSVMEDIRAVREALEESTEALFTCDMNEHELAFFEIKSALQRLEKYWRE